MMSRTGTVRTVERTYKNAIDLLNQRRRPKRPTAKAAPTHNPSADTPDIGRKSDVRGTPSLFGMKHWLQQLGHSASDVDALNVVHIAGTKGKGSTCAFVNAFLQAHSDRCGFPRKVGLYTSPHLIFPEERIRINSVPLKRDAFAKYFFEVSDILLPKDAPSPDAQPLQPRFLQIFFLVAIHAFLREGVDAAIIETHHGGEYDATNVVDHPVATAVTSLGMDHVNQLGPTIEDIAWHKAGIFKPGAAAFSIIEDAPIAKVLRDRANEKGANLTFVDLNPTLPQEEIRLMPDVQRLNCSLALAVTESFLRSKAPTIEQAHLSPADIVQGVRRFSWPGRFQIVRDLQNQWYMDGAHNEMSVAVAGQWFVNVSQAQRQDHLPRILIFGQVSKQRDSLDVLRALAASLPVGDISHAIFTIYDPSVHLEASTETSLTPDDERALHKFADIWSGTHSGSTIQIASDVPQALAMSKAWGDPRGGMQTLITGSQHLVGAALFHLGQYKKDF